MAHLMPSSRHLLAATSRSRSSICQACSAQLSRQSVRTGFIQNAMSIVSPFARGDPTPEMETAESVKARADAQAAKEEEERNRVTTWEGLEWVGSRKYIWENAKRPGVQRWAPADITPQESLRSELLCALVETLLVHNGSPKASLEIKQLQMYNEDDFFDLFPSGISVLAQPSGPKLAISDEHRSAILNNREWTPPTKPFKTKFQGETYSSWKEIPLEPLSMRFTFLKRVFQRTGHRVPDSSIARCTTAGILNIILKEQRKSTRKLAQEIQEGGAFQLKDGLNVDFKPTRVTKIDKDMMLGRWKLTREKLAKAGLPEFWTSTVPELNEIRRRTVQPDPDREPVNVWKELEMKKVVPFAKLRRKLRKDMSENPSTIRRKGGRH